MIFFFKQIEKIDVVTAAMGHALATEGGFCTGNTRIIDYQVNHDRADELITNKTDERNLTLFGTLKFTET